MLSRLIVALLLALFVGLLTGNAALGHAELVRSQPGNGEQVADFPASILLYYSQGVDFADIQVLDANGQRVDRGEVIISAPDRTVVEVPLTQGGSGVYTVKWEVLAEDGHTTNGNFFFLVGAAEVDPESLRQLFAGARETAEVSNPLEAIARGLLFLSLSLLVGVPLALLVVIPLRTVSEQLEPARLLRNARRLLMAAAALTLVASLVLLANQVYRSVGEPTVAQLQDLLLTTSFGRAALIRFALAGAVLFSGLMFARSSRAWLVASVLAGVIGQLTVSLSSHTWALVTIPGAWLFDLLHLLGGAVWIGGLAALAVLVPSPRGRAEQALGLLARATQRFAALALAAVAVLGATGLWLMSFHVPQVQSLPTTDSGTALLVKNGLMVVILGLAGWQRLVLVPALARHAQSAQNDPGQLSLLRRFRRTIRSEALLVAGVFLVSGVLTSLPPAGVEERQRAAATNMVSQSATVGEVSIDLTLIPGQVGLNVVDVAFRKQGQPIGSLEDVQVLPRQRDAGVELPRVVLTPAEDGTYSGLVSLTLPGSWSLRVGAMVDGRFTTHTFAIEPRERAGTLPEQATTAFQIAARGVGSVLLLIGGILVGYEFRRLRQRTLLR